MLWKSFEEATGDAAGTEPTVSMTGVPTDGTLVALEELTDAVAPPVLAGPVTEDDDDGVEAEGIKWESLSEWEWRSGCGPVVLLLLPLAVLV